MIRTKQNENLVIYPTLTTKTCLRLVSYRLQWTQNGSVEGDFDNRALSLHHYHIRIYAYTAYIVRLMNLQCVQDRTDQRPVQMSYEIFQGGFKKTIKYKTQKKRRNQTKWKQQQQQIFIKITTSTGNMLYLCKHSNKHKLV